MLFWATWALCLAGYDRPCDPWVFRSVLDERPRALTLALNDELWVAYDTGWCSLYKVWKGDVQWSERSPGGLPDLRAVSRGDAYTQASEGLIWWLVQDGEARAVRPRYRGHRLENGQARLLFELELEGGVRVHVSEIPEFVRPQDLFEDPSSQAPWLRPGLVGLRRSFTASGLPEGVSLRMHLGAACEGYLMDRLLDLVETPLEADPLGRRLRLDARLPLDAGQPTNEIIFFFEPSSAPVPAPAPESAPGTSPGPASGQSPPQSPAPEDPPENPSQDPPEEPDEGGGG